MGISATHCPSPRGELSLSSSCRRCPRLWLPVGQSSGTARCSHRCGSRRGGVVASVQRGGVVTASCVTGAPAAKARGSAAARASLCSRSRLVRRRACSVSKSFGDDRHVRPREFGPCRRSSQHARLACPRVARVCASPSRTSCMPHAAAAAVLAAAAATAAIPIAANASGPGPAVAAVLPRRHCLRETYGA